MNGIFSSAPCQSSIRLVVGTQLLLLVQAGIIIWARPAANDIRGLVLLAFALGLAGFIAAVCGESSAPRVHWRERRRGR
ncbi:hypothetical protein VHN57_10265 [Sphingobium sp. WW5]|jgi:hypothetical protein|uniref:hypothetical protein n=1 Tax=unclassified Sphingobium TaxID=2611147 RepID=UPI00065C99FE